MPVWLLQFFNVFFLIFHTALVVFNMVGWAWKRTRRAHVWTVGLTTFSWVVMGLWKGVGYCVCTDLHWQVRAALGIHDPDSTYIQFLVRLLTGWSPSNSLVRTVTGGCFLVIIALTIGFGIKDRRSAAV